MTTYRYKASTLIDRVEVTAPRSGVTHATIVAAPDADGHALEGLREKLGSLGFSTLMDTLEDGRATIQVRGIESEEALIEAMERLDLAKNGVEKDLVKADHPPEKFSERVRGKSLFLSALFYDLGNIALMISGVQRGRHNRTGTLSKNDWSEIATGGAFALGDVLMTFYGNEKGDEELHAASQGLEKYLRQKGLVIPEGDALNPDTLHQSGVLKAAHRWLHKHISHVKCLTELAGGLFMIHAGLKRDHATGNRNVYKMAAGALITTAWAGTFMLEEPRGHKIFDGSRNIVDGKEPPPETLMDKITRNPRAWIAAPMAMGNNVLNLIGANKERVDGLGAIRRAKDNPAELQYAQAKQHDYLWNILTASSFLVAHSLFGLSGSHRPRDAKDDKIVMDDLVLLSANVLSRQQEEVRDAAISDTADYLVQLAHVNATKQQVEQAIRDKVESITHSSWVTRAQMSFTKTHHGSTAAALDVGVGGR